MIVPETTSKRITASGLLLIFAILALLARLGFAYASWPAAFLPLAVWIVWVLIRGVREGLTRQ